jgi:O-antigen ligase
VSALLLDFTVADGHDRQRGVELIVLVACAIATVLRNRGSALASASMPVQLGIAGFFTLGLASAMTAWSLRHALYEWSSMILLAMLTLAVCAEVAKTGADGLQRILQWVGAACVVYSLRVLLMYTAALASGYQIDMHHLAIGFSNARFLNHTQTALLPMLVLLCLTTPAGSALRRLWFVLLAFWWALLYVCEARASLLGLGAACVACLLLGRRHARQFIWMMGLTALAGVAVYILAFVLLPMSVGMEPFGSAANVIQRTAADPASHREVLWMRAWELISAHPWLGVGPLHFAHYGADLQTGAHPHDWLMQIATEWGVPALLCALFVVGRCARALWRSGAYVDPSDLRNQHVFAAFVAAGTAIFVDALFSGVLVMPASRLAIALVIGCAAGWVRYMEAQCAPAHRALPPGHGIAVLAAVGAVTLTCVLAPDLGSRLRGEPLSAAEQRVNLDVHWPRMWEAGYF